MHMVRVGKIVFQSENKNNAELMAKYYKETKKLPKSLHEIKRYYQKKYPPIKNKRKYKRPSNKAKPTKHLPVLPKSRIPVSSLTMTSIDKRKKPLTKTKPKKRLPKKNTPRYHIPTVPISSIQTRHASLISNYLSNFQRTFSKDMTKASNKRHYSDIGMDFFFMY